MCDVNTKGSAQNISLVIIFNFCELENASSPCSNQMKVVKFSNLML
jgi:hypothetical protein